jgi:hypothetical protein
MTLLALRSKIFKNLSELVLPARLRGDEISSCVVCGESRDDLTSASWPRYTWDIVHILLDCGGTRFMRIERSIQNDGSIDSKRTSQIESMIIQDPLRLLHQTSIDAPSDCPLCKRSAPGPCAICRMIRDANAMDLMARSNAKYTNQFARARWGLPFSFPLDPWRIAVPLPRTDCMVAVMFVGHDFRCDETAMVVEQLVPAVPGMKCMDSELDKVLRQTEELVDAMPSATISERFYEHVLRDNRERIAWAFEQDCEKMDDAAIKDRVGAAIQDAIRKSTYFVNLRHRHVELLLPITWTEGRRYLFATVSVDCDKKPTIRTLLSEEMGASNIIAMLGACVLSSKCLL